MSAIRRGTDFIFMAKASGFLTPSSGAGRERPITFTCPGHWIGTEHLN